ncbi:hypothetical protein BABINDRAFT_180557 [Babjeviella inositovora NRRL Y-12698]|uniref:F-box domain-containing protein n=1 Tax=Babjeviella inositovora NRRL Y-12698 TaxID=984486 RepID=A0A1E3QNY4_9ASCO|nr:uncharacterized protein BABINDRAFT_180557 [Babjeviella inositovora NRRL Y-12698]ODQ79419.1 hypothetical protein BABINDRAFT_180557 [Babjeviella inositovora NRRL Y-12698]
MNQLIAFEHPAQATPLPLEIIKNIVDLVYYDNENATSIITNLESFAKSILPLNKAMHGMSVKLLYQYANFTRPQSFDKFLHTLVASPYLGQFVEVIDFQEFTSVGLGRTNRMMQEIQMVTSDTIHACLTETPNLREFLASESIQDDMDARLLTFLFNSLPTLETVDFCGANSDKFARAFQDMTIGDAAPTANLRNVSFHDCTNLSVDVFTKILPRLTNVSKLDLSHTQVTSKILVNCMPLTAKLTHLSLARCCKVTTNDLMQFLMYHPSIRNSGGALKWLNLQVDSSVVAPFTAEQLHEVLRGLNAPNLEYLNLGGLPIDATTLAIVKKQFPKLQSVTLAFAKDITLADVVEFLKGKESQIKLINLLGVAKFNRYTISHLMQQQAASFPALESIEFDAEVLQTLAYEAYQTVSITSCIPATESSPAVFSKKVWKFFDNQGRRGWLNLLKPDASGSDYVDLAKFSGGTSLVRYDMKTGKKIVTKVEVPEFLQYASRKINCSKGAFNKSRGNEFHKNQMERGIYKYYSLNVK